MPEENHGQSNRGEPNRQTSIDAPIQSTGDQPIPTKSANDNTDNDQDNTTQLTKEFKHGEKWLIGIGIATLLINSGIGLIYWGQLKEMKKATDAATQASQTAKDTLTEMRTGSGATDTHILAQQASTQAIQTTNLAKAAGDQATQTENLANDALIQTKAANALAIQAQRSADYAKQAVDTAIDAERPWLGVSAFNPENFAEGKTAKFNVTYVNTGKRPATASMIYRGDPLTKFPGFPHISSVQHPSISFLLPGATGQGVFEYELSKDALTTWKRERKIFYFMAEIVYTDVGTNIGHITHFCVYYDPANKDIPWPLCPGYNEAR